MPNRRVRNMENVIEEQSVNIKPVSKRREESAQEYVAYFKRIVKANDWSDVRAGTIFPAMLPYGDSSLSTVERLGTAAFSVIEQALTDSQEPFREANLHMLLNSKREAFKDLFEFKQKIFDLTANVYPSFSMKQREQLARDFFLNGLTAETRSKVLVLHPASLDDAVNGALMAESLEPVTPVVELHAKEEDESLKDDCSQHVGVESIKKNCQTNWQSRQSYRKTNHKFRNSKKGSCQTCDCSKRSSKVGDVVMCYNCGGEGHIARLCPSPQKPWSMPEKQGNSN